MTIPLASERPTVTVREGAQWFGVSPATFYRAVKDGRAPCDVVHVGARVVIVTASARRVLGLEVPAPNGAGAGEEA
jgi:predicted DNA-binding transcriptional regulator AlpA